MLSLIQAFSGFMLTIGAALDISAPIQFRADEAKTRVRQCLAHIRRVGTVQAFADFDEAGSQDDQHHSYCLFVYDLSNQSLIYGSLQRHAPEGTVDDSGPEQLNLQAMLVLVQSQGCGWLEPRRSGETPTYVEMMDQYFIGCSALH